ncbi:hypothetical protein J4430_01950 [Candidatus Woesearchaeota archaeon]|nr:hypothetical protein [Candidatus Woesearchaeota archaeon]
MNDNKITAKIVIEIVGQPKDHVEQIINDVINKLKSEEDITVHESVIYDAAEVKGFWSTFADVDISVPNLDRLIGICVYYMPSSLEIVSPPQLSILSSEASVLFNDFLSRLHQYDFHLKNIRAELQLLKQGKP